MPVRIGQTFVRHARCPNWTRSLYNVQTVPKIFCPSAYTSRWQHSITQSKYEILSRQSALRPAQSPTSWQFKLIGSRRASSASTGSENPTAEDESLPSHAANKRWQTSHRLQATMDGLLSKAESASRRLNVYTGTDYTGIETLRRAILEQEEHVKTSHLAVASARQAHSAALAQQSSSQKEVVGLLERKASWTATDLERYMALIRSEHINEQAVQRAASAVAESERQLEEARSTLEKKERRQYHEEQVWSDTIRRNSTWVTFGLMGLNIVLLLVNLVLVEPWRRKRLVKEVRAVLDEKAIALPVDTDQEAVPVKYGGSDVASGISTGDGDGERLAVANLAVPQETPLDLVEVSREAPTSSVVIPMVDGARGLWERYRNYLEDLFSERRVTLKRVDVTTVALQGAASGVAITGLLFVWMGCWR